jgi:hypothetical protein
MFFSNRDILQQIEGMVNNNSMLSGILTHRFTRLPVFHIQSVCFSSRPDFSAQSPGFSHPCLADSLAESIVFWNGT